MPSRSKRPGGRRLRVTPNHPVATARGFVAAATIRPGECVLSQGGDVWGQLLRHVTPQIDHEYQPPTIDQVFDALAMTSPPRRAATAPEDLHGDAARTDGYIDVVLANRVLHGGSRADGLGDLALPSADARHAGRVCPRHAMALRDRLGLAAHGVVSAGHLSGALLRHHPGPLERLGLGLPAQGNARIAEPASERASADPALVGQLLERLPADVFLDQVVEVRNFQFRGHVYDLQTETGWIVADGIYTSNCRCVVLAWLARWGGMRGETHAKGELPTPRELETEHAGSEHRIGSGRIGVAGAEEIPIEDAPHRAFGIGVHHVRGHDEHDAVPAESEPTRPASRPSWVKDYVPSTRQVVHYRTKSGAELDEEERQRQARDRAAADRAEARAKTEREARWKAEEALARERAKQPAEDFPAATAKTKGLERGLVRRLLGAIDRIRGGG